ncbi:MAG: hypothetical protein QOI41_3991 [Myxococcales bacterium]|nr:hypothetical protein [Myxococcales bacterium]
MTASPKLVPKLAALRRSIANMGRRPLAALSLLAGLGLVACPKPTDGDPQIAISPNVEKRLPFMRGHGDPTPRKPQPSANARSHAHPMKAGEQLGGPNATGKAGDWMLENDEVVFVIDALGGGGGFAESGGNLVDAADAKVRKDELGQLFTYFGTFPRQGVYTKIEATDLPTGEAIIVARGRELYDASLEVETEYRLAGADRALLVSTTVKNTGKADVMLPALGDAIPWGGAEKLAPGKAVGFKGASSGPFIGGVGRFTSYAITTPDGTIAAMSGGAWTDTEQKKNVTIAAGASETYQRVFAVGERADVASIVTELTKASEGAVGGLEISLVDAAGKAVKAPAGAKVVLATPAGDEVMTIIAPTADIMFGGEVPPGKWLVAYAPSAGRRAVAVGKATVDVKKGAVAKVSLAVTDVAKIDAGCTEKDASGAEIVPVLPCKVTFEGLDGTAAPDLGPAHVTGPAKNQLIANTGEVAVAPGKYRLTFTRGPEYGAEVSEVVLAPGATRTVSAALRRVVDTSGYLATDFHQHTILSADAPVSTRDRILSNAAEAVELAVATEHNVIADLAPLVRELGMSRFVVSIPGDELTTDASKKPWGHANVFPLAVDATKARGGAPAVRDRLAHEVFEEMRSRPGPRSVLQVNHPRSGTNGYFDQLGFDPKTGVGTGAGYDADFDALEVWNGRNVDARMKVLDDLLALLRTSHPVTAIADTDTHGIVGQEAGLPRTYVRVTKDDALDAWDASRTDDLVRNVREKRDVVLTNGPFLRVTANGVGIGGIAAARGGLVEVNVHVATSSFAAVDHAELRVAGSAKIDSKPAVTLVPKKTASGALEADVTFTVRASADDAFVVIVSGSRPMKPMFSGEDRELLPWAMSGAIWIDANGDGKSLAREVVRR